MRWIATFYGRPRDGPKKAVEALPPGALSRRVRASRNPNPQRSMPSIAAILVVAKVVVIDAP